MAATDTQALDSALLATLFSEEAYYPTPPRSIEETGLSEPFIEALMVKYLNVIGTSSGQSLADFICLPFPVIEGILANLRSRQLAVHAGSAPFNDYYYTLTEQGRKRAQTYMDACAYVGPAPVTLKDYEVSVAAQTIGAEAAGRQRIEDALRGITVEAQLFDSLGPAVNSGAGMFLFGAPGNGKSTIARRLTMCFGQRIWIPQSLIEDGQIIVLYDSAYHERETGNGNQSLLKRAEHDRRWVKIRRPTVMVGGELTLESLEIGHDPRGNVCTAPLQMKSNCGCLLIDDFGRQRVEPAALLNRWIVPLEAKHDFLTLPTGKKIQVPFEQLIIFSTNLEPSDLVDEAFLRRIPYKIEVRDPSEDEFHRLFQLYATNFGCEYRRDVVDHLIKNHYQAQNRPLRRCHARDLLIQVRNYCTYMGLPMEMRQEHLDRVVTSYFSMVRVKS